MKALFLMPPFSKHASRRDWHMLEEFYNPMGCFECVYLVSLDEESIDLPEQIGSLRIFSVRGDKSRRWALIFGNRIFALLNPVARFVCKIAKENNIDILVQRYGGPLKHGVPVVWAARSLGLPSIVTMQSDYANQLGLHYGFIRRVFISVVDHMAWKLLLENSTIIWSVSNYLSKLPNMDCVPASKIKVIPNKDTISRFHQEVGNNYKVDELFNRLQLADWKTKKLLFLAVGRLIPAKNYPRILDAFRKVLDKYPEAVLVIVGQGELENELEKKICVSKMSQNVRIIKHYFSTEDLVILYRQAIALLFCSLYEGQGRVVYEAMATGTPVIGSNVGPIPEMIEHNRNGMLVDPSDVGQIASAIEMFCVGSVTKAELAGYCRETADRYDLSIINPKEAELYQYVLNRSVAT